jgi:peptide/nickel transport system substrate-binding protein
VDMDRLLEITRGGVATTANQITPPGLDGHDDSIQYYRPRYLDKARELLAEAGYGEGELSIQMHVWNRKSATTDMELLATQISEAGINTEMVPVEFSTYLSEMGKGVYGFYVTGQTWTPDSADWMAANWSSDGPRNGIGYSNPEVDALLEEAQLELDMDKRGELITRAEVRILEDSVYVPYFHDKDVIAIQPWVHGLLDPNIAATGQGFWVTRFEKVWLDPEYRDD